MASAIRGFDRRFESTAGGCSSDLIESAFAVSGGVGAGNLVKILIKVF